MKVESGDGRPVGDIDLCSSRPLDLGGRLRYRSGFYGGRVGWSTSPAATSPERLADGFVNLIARFVGVYGCFAGMMALVETDEKVW
jgi:hypothetical protein